MFGDRYFIEIMNNGGEVQRRLWRRAVEVATPAGLPLVATCDAHYVDREDAESQDVLLCINTGKFRTDTNRMRMDGDQYYLRSPQEMYAAFPGLEDAVAPQPGNRRQRGHRSGAGQAAFPGLPAAAGEDGRAAICANSASRV